jgi:hypothetical protein
MAHNRVLIPQYAQCPLWVKSRHLQCINPCPLYSQKRTFGDAKQMSALGQKRTLGLWLERQSLITLHAQPVYRFRYEAP